jgi:AraC-like DNA-binding protein/GNAT superfamily N-acetyltransferase
MERNIAIVKEAIHYIETHLQEKIDLEIVAKSVHYSKYHLHRMFTNSVGLTLHEYVQRRQLTEAAKSLVFFDRPILDIALCAGYESQQSFSAIFKAMYKKTPYQYRTDEEFYPLQLRYHLLEEPLPVKADDDWQKDIVFATMEDIPLWMDLVRLVVDGFPCLKEESYKKLLEKNIREGRALIMKEEKIAIGIMVFNYNTGSIDFLGIHPQYRKQGMAKTFLQKVMDEYPSVKEISITTFREGDKADPGYRKTCKELGFTEAELLVEFGYPTQKFILHKQH